jgi:hypothetical protein
VLAGTFNRAPIVRPPDLEAEALLGERAAQPLAHSALSK